MNSRRKFIGNASALTIGTMAAPFPVWGKSASAANDQLNIGLIGVGLRGTSHLKNLLLRSDVNITAICDIDPARISVATDLITKTDRKAAVVYSDGEYDYRNLLESKNVDAVIISTPWSWHVPMSVDAMMAGKYAGVEVSAATTLDGCWALVKAHEESGTHLMILENVNYRSDVLAVLNMVKKGIFGELVHFRCGYQHDLREVKFNNGQQVYGGGVEFGEKAISEASWRTQYSVDHNADVYPTHGLGPIAVMCDVNRGNQFMSMSSFATKGIGLHNHIVNKGGADHPNAAVKFRQGDIITSTIKTFREETIIITHDCNLPRPYSLGFRVQGAKGLWEVDGNRIYVEGRSEPHKWDSADEWLEEYEHPLWKTQGEIARGSGHGGMDYFVLNAFVESAKRNIAPPLDVYDAAAWSAVTPLSEASIANGGAPQEFPDFTAGRWRNREPHNWLKDDF